MGLQNQLTDVSTDSIPLFLLLNIANGVCYLRSLILTFLHSLHFSHDVNLNINVNDAVLFEGLAGIILLADHLNLNRVLSYKYIQSDERTEDSVMTSDCVVCLNSFSDGEHVRKLTCQHMFHKECFDGWIHQLNFSCPICRSPVVSG